MNGINRATLAGNVGDDPRPFEKDGQLLNVSFSLATNEVYRNKNGEEVKKTQWHHVVVWNKSASLVQQYVKKGDPLLVEGKITYDEFDDKDGVHRKKTEIVCENFVFLSSGKKSA